MKTRIELLRAAIEADNKRVSIEWARIFTAAMGGTSDEAIALAEMQAKRATAIQEKHFPGSTQ